MISTRARIALHGLADLAKADSSEPTSFPRLFSYLQTWSESLPLSRGYVGKIFQDLSKAGLVRSVPGRRGGYRMARPATGVTALDVPSRRSGCRRGRTRAAAAGWAGWCAAGTRPRAGTA